MAGMFYTAQHGHAFADRRRGRLARWLASWWPFGAGAGRHGGKGITRSQ